MKSTHARAIALAICAAGTTGLSACSLSNEVRVPFHQTIPVTGHLTFSLENTAGTVHIETWNQPRIDISGYKTGGSVASASAIKIDVRRAGQAVAVSTDYPAGVSGGGGAFYRIRLPETMPVSVDNAAGTIDIRGAMSDVTGTVGAGTLDVTMARLTGTQRVILKSSTGTVSLHVPSSSNATFATHIGAGSVKTNVPSTLGNGTAQVDLTATFGTITIDRT